MKNFTVKLLVTNHYGVLSRVTSLYSRRGCNIDSLYVKATENPALSRMTIVAMGDEPMQTQMVRQLSKLYDVREVALVAAGERRDRQESPGSGLNREVV